MLSTKYTNNATANIISDAKAINITAETGQEIIRATHSGNSTPRLVESQNLYFFRRFIEFLHMARIHAPICLINDLGIDSKSVKSHCPLNLKQEGQKYLFLLYIASLAIRNKLYKIPIPIKTAINRMIMLIIIIINEITHSPANNTIAASISKPKIKTVTAKAKLIHFEKESTRADVNL